MEIEKESLIIDIDINNPQIEVFESDEKAYAKIGSLIIKQYHEQDCCEIVYADFSVLEFYNEMLKKFNKINKIIIKQVEGCGFLLTLKNDSNSISMLINCYDIQNGYYSSSLDIIIEYKGKKFKTSAKTFYIENC